MATRTNYGNQPNGREIAEVHIKSMPFGVQGSPGRAGEASFVKGRVTTEN